MLKKIDFVMIFSIFCYDLIRTNYHIMATYDSRIVR